MPIAELLPLIVFAGVATLTPGGATTLATASGSHFGYRRSLPLMAGIALGFSTMAALAAAGLGGIILALPLLQWGMKFVGTLYLLGLAWRIAHSGPPRLSKNARSKATQHQEAHPTTFWAALGLILANPKAWAMSLGAAASFAALAANPMYLGLLVGTAFGLAAMMSLSLWCVAGQVLASLLHSPSQWRAINGLLALALGASIVPMWRD